MSSVNHAANAASPYSCDEMRVRLCVRLCVSVCVCVCVSRDQKAFRRYRAQRVEARRQAAARRLEQQRLAKEQAKADAHATAMSALTGAFGAAATAALPSTALAAAARPQTTRGAGPAMTFDTPQRGPHARSASQPHHGALAAPRTVPLRRSVSDDAGQQAGDRAASGAVTVGRARRGKPKRRPQSTRARGGQHGDDDRAKLGRSPPLSAKHRSSRHGGDHRSPTTGGRRGETAMDRDGSGDHRRPGDGHASHSPSRHLHHNQSAPHNRHSQSAKAPRARGSPHRSPRRSPVRSPNGGSSRSLAAPTASQRRRTVRQARREARKASHALDASLRGADSAVGHAHADVSGSSGHPPRAAPLERHRSDDTPSRPRVDASGGDGARGSHAGVARPPRCVCVCVCVWLCVAFAMAQCLFIVW